ncbi:uncharacterized protein VTP21DRAFT_207 [Calcarisporiella thermophila]|uniref:uncharacterized protein n=1 Tax=Calcarisporiella thermophila TaxID=911321 RepID=UPI00374267C0
MHQEHVLPYQAQDQHPFPTPMSDHPSLAAPHRPQDGIDARPNYSNFNHPMHSPATPRQPASPPLSGGPLTPLQDKDGRASMHGSPLNQIGFPPIRKRRTDPIGFPPEAGPFFCPTRQHHNLYSMDRMNGYKLRIQSKVDKGFFLSENDWTCYRRNYFQVSSAFSVLGTNYPLNEPETPCLIEIENGRFCTVTQFLLGISARVSNSEKRIELVQHTPKRDKGAQPTIVTFERIQFKTATANNGKRRAAQQYYILLIDLYAFCDNGQQYKVATTQSAPLVVRGRSPGHYSDGQGRYSPMGVTSPPIDGRFYPSFGRPPMMPTEMQGYQPYSYGSPYPPLQSPHGMYGNGMGHPAAAAAAAAAGMPSVPSQNMNYMMPLHASASRSPGDAGPPRPDDHQHQNEGAEGQREGGAGYYNDPHSHQLPPISSHSGFHSATERTFPGRIEAPHDSVPPPPMTAPLFPTHGFGDVFPPSSSGPASAMQRREAHMNGFHSDGEETPGNPMASQLGHPHHPHVQQHPPYPTAFHQPSRSPGAHHPSQQPPHQQHHPSQQQQQQHHHQHHQHQHQHHHPQQQQHQQQQPHHHHQQQAVSQHSYPGVGERDS